MIWARLDGALLIPAIDEASLCEAVGLMTYSLPRFGDHVAGSRRRRLKRREGWKRFEKKHFRTAASGDLLKAPHHRSHARTCRRDNRHEEVRKAEVGLMNALFDNRSVG